MGIKLVSTGAWVMVRHWWLWEMAWRTEKISVN
jgi:hypothetical protein